MVEIKSKKQEYIKPLKYGVPVVKIIVSDEKQS